MIYKMIRTVIEILKLDDIHTAPHTVIFLLYKYVSGEMRVHNHPPNNFLIIDLLKEY